MKPEIEALRRAILATHPSIEEEIKWNVPSFRTTEHFATMHLRAKTGIGLVLHLGAKARALPASGLRIDDPSKLLRWLAKDRALIEFSTGKELRERTPALKALLRRWISYV